MSRAPIIMGMIVDSVWVVLAVTDFSSNERQRSESLG